MRKYTIACLILIISGLLTSYAQAQIVSCTDISFESGTFGAWTGQTGSIDGSGVITLPTPGLVNGRHTIMTPGVDPLVGIPTVPAGATHSVRLGNDASSKKAESMEITFTVTAAQSTFQYQYAVVLEDPNHQPHQQPGLEFNMFDALGQPIPCSSVKFVSGGNIPGFQSKGRIRYKDWTTVAVDLMPYIGQKITIKFTTNDCTLGGHFGYCYLTTGCSLQSVSVSGYCFNINGVTLSAPIGYDEYNWSDGQTGQSVFVTNPTPGDTYTVTLKSVSGCQTQASVVIPPKSPKVPEPIPVPVAPACGANLQLEASGSANGRYKWFTSTNSADSIRGEVTNIYNPPFATNSVTYYVAAVDDYGCESDKVAMSTVVLSTPLPPKMTVTDVCVQGTITFTVDETNANTYHWYKDSIGGTAFQASTDKTFTTGILSKDTTFYVSQVSAVNGCESARTKITGQVHPLPVIKVIDNKGCIGEQILLKVSGGVQGKYNWYTSKNPADIIAGANDSTYLTPPLATNTTFYVTAESTIGCTSALDSVVAQVEAPPAAPKVPGVSICSGENATVTINETNTNTFNWYNVATGGTAFQSSGAKTFTSGALTANTKYYVSQTSAAGCESSRTEVLITVNPLPPAPTVTPGKGCAGNSILLQASGSTSGIYRWYTSTNTVDSISGADSATFNTPPIYQNTTYYVAAVSNNGCVSPMTAVIADVKPTPGAPIVSSNQEVCGSGKITLTINENNTYEYRWYTDSTSTVPFKAGTEKTYTTDLLTSTTNFYVSQVGVNGCESPRTLAQAIVNPLPNAPQIIANEGCTGNSVILQISGAANGQYRWYNDSLKTSPINGVTDSLYQTPVLITSTQYYVNIVDAKGCESPLTKVPVTVHELPAPIAKQDTTVCLEDIGNLELDGGENYGHTWNTGETSRYITIAKEGLYTVTTQTVHGCERTDSIKVTTLCDPIVYIPEAFSPNGDGNNDFFKVFGRYLEHIDIMIYNRWGTLIFHSNRLDSAWNGTVKGQIANAGVFRCKVVYRGINGKNKEKQAMIHLVK
ncbi:T9SS C-terminal target domain-containing protein [Microscilla marina]|uniref:Ig-like domain-containing protein n=1 Tax=Microscilla marina ATCC 23134 TaxID=313606 RepID=A1ZQ92_MICM2|nr:T9SS C-terminal target domain-containing protein [Microscilla marina]EAY27501.1 hypothetical protein M23134_06902 [Microscilla marina ATCC 23134]